MERLFDVDMRDYTSFRAGGRAAELAIAEDVEELQQLLTEASAAGRSFLMLGNGSNTLFSHKIGRCVRRNHGEGESSDLRRRCADERSGKAGVSSRSVGL